MDDTAELTRAACAGDARAFEQLYRVWSGRVFAMARAMTRRDESHCMDVVHDVMMRAARSIPPLTCEDQAAAWFGRVTMSVVVDTARREGRRQRRERGTVDRVDPPGAIGPEQAELLRWLAEQLRELPQADRDLLIHRYALDWTLKEAGAHVGLSPDAAHGRLRRAVERLRRMAKEIFP